MPTDNGASVDGVVESAVVKVRKGARLLLLVVVVVVYETVRRAGVTKRGCLWVVCNSTALWSHKRWMIMGKAVVVDASIYDRQILGVHSLDCGGR